MTLKKIQIIILFLIINKQGELLLQKRGHNSRDSSGIWSTGAGEIEYGETIEKALEREVFEEYGITLQSYHFLDYAQRIKQLDGKDNHTIGLRFICHINPHETPSIREPDKISQIGWFGPNNLPSPIFSDIPGLFDKINYHLSRHHE